jgi:septum formation topological specificity factor MinE
MNQKLMNKLKNKLKSILIKEKQKKVKDSYLPMLPQDGIELQRYV